MNYRSTSSTRHHHHGVYMRKQYTSQKPPVSSHLTISKHIHHTPFTTTALLSLSTSSSSSQKIPFLHTQISKISIMYKDSDPLQRNIKTKINIYLCDRFNEICASSSSDRWALVLDSKTKRTSNRVRFYATFFVSFVTQSHTHTSAHRNMQL